MISKGANAGEESPARSLLSLYFELKAAEPDLAQWNEEAFQSSPRCLEGLRLLKGALNALKLGPSVKDLRTGRFILFRDLADYEFLKEMAAEGQGPAWTQWVCAGFTLESVRSFYQHLFSYLEHLEAVVSSTRPAPAAQGIELYGQRLIARSNAVIRAQIVEIGELIAAILSTAQARATAEPDAQGIERQTT